MTAVALTTTPIAQPVQAPIERIQAPATIPGTILAPKRQDLFSDLTRNATGFISDISGAFRSKFSFFNYWVGQKDPVAMSALGITTCFASIRGYLNYQDSKVESQFCQEIGDKQGKKYADIRKVRSVAQTAGGAVYIPVRAMTIASEFKIIGAFTHATKVLADIGSQLFNFVYLLVAFATGMSFYHTKVFKNKIQTILGDQALPAAEKCRRCLEKFKADLAITPEERTRIEEKFRSMPIETRPAAISLELQKITLVKERALARLCNKDCVNAIKAARVEDAEAIVAKVQAAVNKKMLLAGVLIGICVISLLPFLLSFVLAGQTLAITSATLSATGALGWVGYDGYELTNDFKETSPGRYDRLWLNASSVLCMTAIVLAVALAFDPLTKMLSLIFGALWLLVNVICSYRLSKMQRTAPVS